VAGLRTLCAGLAVLSASPAALAQEVDCSDTGALPQQQINMCLALRFERADHQMQAAYTAALARVGREDAVTLAAAQDAWITYRSTMCVVEAGFMRGGSGETLLRLACLARITATRVRWFNEYLTQCEEELFKLDPRKYPRAAELRGQTTYAHSVRAVPGAVQLGKDDEDIEGGQE